MARKSPGWDTRIPMQVAAPPCSYAIFAHQYGKPICFPASLQPWTKRKIKPNSTASHLPELLSNRNRAGLAVPAQLVGCQHDPMPPVRTVSFPFLLKQNVIKSLRSSQEFSSLFWALQMNNAIRLFFMQSGQPSTEVAILPELGKMCPQEEKKRKENPEKEQWNNSPANDWQGGKQYVVAASKYSNT